MRRDAQRLSDIVEAAGQVANYIDGRTDVQFVVDRFFQDAVLRQLTIVGEAASKLSAQFRSAHPEIPWARIVGFRHRVVHDYFGFNLDTAWKVASVEVAILATAISQILAREYPEEI
jgi:uncharacterized protein with HEPN domain